MSCHVMSCHVLSCHVMSSHVLSRLLTSCHVMSRHVLSCHVMSSHVFARLVIACHLARESCSQIFLPSLLNSSIMAAGWPRRGFRNRGPVRESGSERRSRCGAACTASVCVWRRAHFWDLGIVLRGRLRGSGVMRACWEVCRGRAAALCRGDWVPGVFCTCMSNVRFAWQAAGIVRAGSVLAGMPRRCAVGIGFRARFVHAWPTCVSRGRLRGSCVLGGVSRVCRGRSAVGIGFGVCRTRARFYALRPAFRVAGVGLRMHCCAREGTGRWIRVAGAMNRARSPKSLVFVALCEKSRARARVGRCEIVAGAGIPWICGFELGADVSGNAAAGCVGRVVTMGVGRVARAARAALCRGDCCWACRVGAAVPWGLLVCVSRGLAAPWGLLGGLSSRWRRVLGIADQGMVWVAPCHWYG